MHLLGGLAKFANVSKDLLYVDYCAAWDTSADLLRFYEVAAGVS